MHQRRPRACLAWIGDGLSPQSMTHPVGPLLNKNDAGVPVNSRGSYPQPDRVGTDTRSQNDAVNEAIVQRPSTAVSKTANPGSNPGRFANYLRWPKHPLRRPWISSSNAQSPRLITGKVPVGSRQIHQFHARIAQLIEQSLDKR